MTAAAWGLTVAHLGVTLSGLAAFLGLAGWERGLAGPFDGLALAAAVALAAVAGAWYGGTPVTRTTRARRLEVAGGLVVFPAAWVTLLAAFAPRAMFGSVPFVLLPLLGNALPTLAVYVVVYGFGPFAAGPDPREAVDLDWNERN